jgi:hypothetical protein
MTCGIIGFGQELRSDLRLRSRVEGKGDPFFGPRG